MRALKRTDWKELRKHAHARTGEKVLIAWDSACIDYDFWANVQATGRRLFSYPHQGECQLRDKR
jgi:hypothetical protein